MSKIQLAPPASGTATFTIASPATNTDRTLTLPDATGTVATLGTSLTLATAQASTSGTAIDFIGIPSWVKRVTVMFSGVSTSGTSFPLIQIGDSGGIETADYVSVSGLLYGTTPATAASTAGFVINSNVAAHTLSGACTLSLLNANTWVAHGCICSTVTANQAISISGAKTLSATLDRVRITTVNGTDTFDAGTINIMYEG